MRVKTISLFTFARLRNEQWQYPFSRAFKGELDSVMGILRVHLSLGDTVYVSDEKDHGIIEQFIPYGKLIVRLVKKGEVLKLSRGDVKKSRH